MLFQGEALFKIGETPYLSTLSLTMPLRVRASAAGVNLVQARLTEISAALVSGELVAGPISVSEYLRYRDRFDLVPNIAVSSCGRASCGLLFSRGPLGGLDRRAIAVPARHAGIDYLLSSLLWEVYGVEPAFVEATGTVDELLSKYAGAFMFEDDALIANQAPPEGVEVWDLGEAWWQMTQTPLLYMLWVTQRSLPASVSSGIVQALLQAKESAGSLHREIIAEARRRVDLPEKVLEGYLGRFNYDFTPAHERGLTLLDKNFLHLDGFSPERYEVPRP